MAEPWIRVHANLPARPVVGRLSDALKVRRAEAVGLLVALWGQVAQHGRGGNISGVSDRQLEEWAGWAGKRGVFAAWVRSAHCTDDGVIRDWEEYQGPLEARRAADRERQRLHRERQALNASHAVVTRDKPPNSSERSSRRHAAVTRDTGLQPIGAVTRDITVTSALARANETLRNETKSSSDACDSADARAAAPPLPGGRGAAGAPDATSANGHWPPPRATAASQSERDAALAWFDAHPEQHAAVEAEVAAFPSKTEAGRDRLRTAAIVAAWRQAGSRPDPDTAHTEKAPSG